MKLLENWVEYRTCCPPCELFLTTKTLHPTVVAPSGVLLSAVGQTISRFIRQLVETNGTALITLCDRLRNHNKSGLAR